MPSYVFEGAGVKFTGHLHSRFIRKGTCTNWQAVSVSALSLGIDGIFRHQAMLCGEPPPATDSHAGSVRFSLIPVGTQA
jgi:hypothetical protein